MALLFVLLVLVLGYYYASAIPAEQLKLRRSAGWETYVYLGFNGLRFIFQGFLVCLIFALPIYILAWLSDSVSAWIGVTFDFSGGLLSFAKYVLLDDIQIYHVCIAVFAWAVCQNAIKNRKEEKWQQQINHYDGMLRIVLQSVNTQVPIRISLKSRKVYVGIVSQEQFSNAESDCILLIPLLSGYRDKDKLDIFYDCSYYAVYQKHNLFDDDLTRNEILTLEDFRIALRASEIESISLFKMELYSDFEYYKKDEIPAQ